MITNKKAYKLGVIGGGINSAVGYAHYSASRIDGRWEYHAGVFSRNEYYNKSSAKLYSVEEEHLYSDYKEMLEHEKDNIDAVLILTPTTAHYEEVMECLNYGIPIICEKALATGYMDAVEISKKAEEKNAFLAMTYNYAGYPMIREIRNMINTGALGDILHFQAEMPQEGFVRLDKSGKQVQPQKWRLSDCEIPTIYLDLGVHIHHLLDYLLNIKPQKVIAIHKSNGMYKEVVDDVRSMVVYGDESCEVHGSIWFSKSSLGYRNGLKLRIFGSKASVEWIQGYPEEVQVSYQNGKKEIMDRGSGVQIADNVRYTRFKTGHPAGYIEAFANLYGDIADCLKIFKEKNIWDTSEVANVKTAVQGLHFLEEMTASSVTGSWRDICLKD